MIGRPQKKRGASPVCSAVCRNLYRGPASRLNVPDWYWKS
jgi:hypothetical protein